VSEGLNRHLAPISPSAWQVIDEIARDTLSVWLAGRRLVERFFTWTRVARPPFRTPGRSSPLFF